MTSDAEIVEYTEGVCSDGAAILRDGKPVSISWIISALESWERHKSEVTRLSDELASWQASLSRLSAHSENSDERLTVLEKGLKTILDLSDTDMRDGDGAREIARALLKLQGGPDPQ